MTTFVFRRLGFMLATLLIISLLIFVMTEVVPGDFASILLGQRAQDETLLAAWRSRLDLDQPPDQRYLSWLAGLFQGDWGTSWFYQTPVLPLVLQRLVNSAVLLVLALLVGVPLGILLGMIAGVYRSRWPDTLMTIGMLLVASLPEFVLGTFLIIIFASWLSWLPATSLMAADTDLREAWSLLVLPILTLVLITLPYIARTTRSSMIDVMEQDYIQAVVLRGIPFPLVVLRHALPNALLPTISVIALSIGWILGGAVVVEHVFAFPGLGSLLLSAVSNQDIPLLQATVLLIAMIYALSNLVADLLSHLLDPRVSAT
ncbi:MAG: ABC transporter permease [Chloroflexaceae bacterium]|nr:ABC transporter permease [Chloroflexaceae bacterium]